MKRQISILLILLILSSAVTVSATITLNPKTPGSSEKVVIVMFDDGWLSQYTNALPILESYGYKASFAIYPKAIDGQYTDYMTWSQIETLSKTGYDIESHTYSHLDLSNMSAAVLRAELVNSKQVLEQHGIQTGALIYPYGDAADNATVKQAVKDAGYLIARGTSDGVIDLSSPMLDYYALNAFPIIDTTNLAYFESNLYDVSGSKIAILLYHQISDTDLATETVTLENFAQQMAYLHDNGFTVKTLSGVFFDITPLPTATPTPSPSPSPSPSPTPTPTATPTPTPTPSPSPSPSPVPTASPTTHPSQTPNPSSSPTASPSSTPLPTSTSVPTPTPTPTPTTIPTATPTPTPTPTPSLTPTTTPQPTSTTEPTLAPASQPTTNPTAAPTSNQTPSPNSTDNPTITPTSTPTSSPTQTASPTTEPNFSTPTQPPNQPDQPLDSTAVTIIAGCVLSIVIAFVLLFKYAK
jgi:peptidoglycan/xylan/chitin deacetylase (PgdA/CDA1 family)